MHFGKIRLNGGMLYVESMQLLVAAEAITIMRCALCYKIAIICQTKS